MKGGLKGLDALGARDVAYLENTSRPNGRGPPRRAGRAADLPAALTPIGAITPVLSSRYLVKGWFDRGTASVVYGESNVGKTFFVLDLALYVAAGLDWHDNRVSRGGAVIYVAGEGGYGINNPIEAIRRVRADLAESSVESGDFMLLPRTLDLCGTGDAMALHDALVSRGADSASLIVIDTLARAMGRGDENTAQDMGAFVRSIGKLRERVSSHVLVAHHTGKDTSKGARGSSSLRAAVDTEVELTRSGDVITAETKKQRDMPSGKVFAYTLRDVVIGKDEDGDSVTSAVVEPTGRVTTGPKLSPQQRIAMQALDDALAHHGEKKQGDIFPPNRRCVSMERWREYCDRHSLSNGNDSSAARKAFGQAWKSLQEKELIRVVDGFVWRCIVD